MLTCKILLTFFKSFILSLFIYLLVISIVSAYLLLQLEPKTPILFIIPKIRNLVYVLFIIELFWEKFILFCFIFPFFFFAQLKHEKIIFILQWSGNNIFSTVVLPVFSTLLLLSICGAYLRWQIIPEKILQLYYQSAREQIIDTKNNLTHLRSGIFHKLGPISLYFTGSQNKKLYNVTGIFTVGLGSGEIPGYIIECETIQLQSYYIELKNCISIESYLTTYVEQKRFSTKVLYGDIFTEIEKKLNSLSDFDFGPRSDFRFRMMTYAKLMQYKGACPAEVNAQSYIVDQFYLAINIVFCFFFSIYINLKFKKNVCVLFLCLNCIVFPSLIFFYFVLYSVHNSFFNYIYLQNMANFGLLIFQLIILLLYIILNKYKELML